MSQTLWKDKKVFIFSLVTAATTVIAGIYHLQMAPGSLSHDLGQGILFLVGGILQVFWAVPVIKRWGKVWQIIGIVGTIIFFALWYASRLHLIPMGGSMPSSGPSHVPQQNIPRGNFTGGEFPKGSPPRGMGLEIGGILVPPIEMFQIAFIGLYAVLSKMISSRQNK
ncbi:MAG TPA: hypothetical protein VFX64_04995 [Candidatus Nitrosotalea sp.]|nr:hypothetical protein [Candidatus Nitrosotalea sp.]